MGTEIKMNTHAEEAKELVGKVTEEFPADGDEG